MGKQARQDKKDKREKQRKTAAESRITHDHHTDTDGGPSQSLNAPAEPTHGSTSQGLAQSSVPSPALSIENPGRPSTQIVPAKPPSRPDMVNAVPHKHSPSLIDRWRPKNAATDRKNNMADSSLRSQAHSPTQASKDVRAQDPPRAPANSLPDGSHRSKVPAYNTRVDWGPDAYTSGGDAVCVLSEVLPLSGSSSTAIVE